MFNQKGIYQIDATYQENFEAGPLLEKGRYPSIAPLPKSEWVDFLGFLVPSTLGVPAGPLLSGEWVLFAAKMGFDLLTYKTVRSFAYPSHPLPNVLFVSKEKEAFYPLGRDAKAPEELTITNSFGMPSQTPEFYLEDIAKTRRRLPDGKLLIVSVVGSGASLTELAADYAACAKSVKDAGADLVEINLSCPNVQKGGDLYLDSECCLKICSAVKQAIGKTHLIVKVGLFPNFEAQKNAFQLFTKGGASAVSGLNSVSSQVIDEKGLPALGKTRPTAGICGEGIRNQALTFIKAGRQIIDEEKLPLKLIGVGGIVRPDHFDRFYEAGADSAMTATGMMWNPYLAAEHKAPIAS